MNGGLGRSRRVDHAKRPSAAVSCFGTPRTVDASVLWVYSGSMRRTAIVLAMLFAMLWQSVVTARVGPTVNVLADREHAALHWNESSHHHHEDGTFHLDDSNESAQHVASDHSSVAAPVPATSAQDVALLAGAALGGLHDSLAPHPFLEGPLRPPRPRAGLMGRARGTPQPRAGTQGGVAQPVHWP